MRGLRSALTALAALAAIVAGGTLLRLEPVRRAGGVEFDFDPAFHIRMVAAVVESGHVPAIDPLGLAPQGKPITTVLPTFLYEAVAFWHRALARLGLTSGLPQSAVLFVALSGALIALPLYAAARGMGLGQGPALLAAAFAAFCPAHLHRTAGNWLRYDALGALLVIAHLAALGAVLSAAGARRRALLAGAAALLLGVSIAAWRVPLLLVALESLALLVIFAGGWLRGRHVVAVGPALAAALILALALPYLRAESFATSRTGILACLALVLALIATRTGLARRRGHRAFVWRAALVLLVLAASLVAGAPSAYDSVGGAVAQKLGLGALDDIGAVLLATNAEMETPRLRHLIDADYFSLLLPLALVYVLGRRFPRRTPLVAALPAAHHPALIGWHLATAAFVLLTLLFARNKVLAGPLLALYPALLVAGGFHAGRGPRRLAVLALALVGLFFTANDARRLAAVLPARRDPATAATLAWLRGAARPGDVLLGDWGPGYAVQLSTGMPTVTDGLLELAEMRRRIAAFATALYAEDEAELIALCRAHGARFIWVPAQKRQIHAAYAGRRFTDYFTGNRPTARGARTNYAKLVLQPAALESLSFRYRAGPHLIYEVAPSGRRTQIQ